MESAKTCEREGDDDGLEYDKGQEIAAVVPMLLLPFSVHGRGAQRRSKAPGRMTTTQRKEAPIVATAWENWFHVCVCCGRWLPSEAIKESDSPNCFLPRFLASSGAEMKASGSLISSELNAANRTCPCGCTLNSRAPDCWIKPPRASSDQPLSQHHRKDLLAYLRRNVSLDGSLSSEDAPLWATAIVLDRVADVWTPRSSVSGAFPIQSKDNPVWVTFITHLLDMYRSSASGHQKKHAHTAQQFTDQEESSLEELWTLLVAMKIEEECWTEQANAQADSVAVQACHGMSQKRDASPVRRRFLVDFPCFKYLYQKIKGDYLHAIVGAAQHPVLAYMENKLLQLSTEELTIALRALHSWGFAHRACHHFQDLSVSTELTRLFDVQSHDDIKASRVSAENKKTGERDVLLWRAATRLAQWASAVRRGEVGESESLIHSFYALCFPTISRRCVAGTSTERDVYQTPLQLEHSCVPDVAMVPVTGMAATSQDNGSAEAICQPLQLQLIALHDIPKTPKSSESQPLQHLTINRLDGDAQEKNLSQRRNALQRTMSNWSFVCHCLRCKQESGQLSEDDTEKNDGKRRLETGEEYFGFAANDIEWRDWRKLGHVAMQSGQYKLAEKMYQQALRQRPHDGDTLHARCASYLARGQFLAAHRLWKMAFVACPQHNHIALHARKQEAYGILKHANEESDLMVYNSSVAEFDTIMERKCFMTKSEHPLFTAGECEQVIEWAEDHARLDQAGWTTSRHYAVPTTDIPLHEIPKLLQWFQSIAMKRIAPLLQAQFGLERPLLVHDAFVVRYDAAGGQRHLPLHRDESTHSFAVALNDGYVGGGTYIVDLGRSLRPWKGGVMSFRGDELLHGGDALVAGTRYIIVAFCYLNEESPSFRLAEGSGESGKLDAPSAKRPKLKDMFQPSRDSGDQRNPKNNDEAATFSFGFQLD